MSYPQRTWQEFICIYIVKFFRTRKCGFYSKKKVLKICQLPRCSMVLECCSRFAVGQERKIYNMPEDPAEAFESRPWPT